MKRTIRLLALILTLTLALSAAAMATEIDYEKGETNATKSVSARIAGGRLRTEI